MAECKKSGKTFNSENKIKMLIQVEGWYGGGKSIIVGLLDGHPDVFSTLLPDYSFISFLSYPQDEIIRSKNIEALRKILAGTQYYNIERAANDGYFSFDFAASAVHLKVPFKMDFYEYEKQYIKELRSMPNWSFEKVMDVLYKHYFLALNPDKRNKIPKYFAGLGISVLEFQKRFREVYPNSKFIFIKRRILNTVATRANRKLQDHQTSMQSFYSPGISRILKSGEIYRILEYRDYFERMAQLYPETYKIIDFDELNLNTESVMRNVCDFLSIDFTDDLLKFSFMGNEIIHNGKKHVGEELDMAEKLLSSQEIAAVNSQISRYKHLKKIRFSNRIKFFIDGFSYLSRRLKEKGL